MIIAIVSCFGMVGILLPTQSEAHVASRAKDSLSLVMLYQTLGGEQWLENSRWLSDRPIDQWARVTVEDDRVVGLDLALNNLTGHMPDSLPGLDGLLVFWLSNNELQGEIPVYANMSSLQEFDLGFNAFTGTIPDSLRELQNLKALWLNDNLLSGTVPVSLSHLENLSFLNLSDNLLGGDLPNELAELDTLSYIDVSGNSFTSLPDFSNSRVIANIRCHNNQLDFVDLLPNASVRNFVYAPQDTVGVYVDTTVVGGSTLRLYVQDPQQGNVYQWFFNGSPLAAERDTLFEEYNMTNAKAGLYHYETMNPALPELSIVARPTLVRLTLSQPVLRDTVICRGRSLRLNPQVQGGILPYTITWSPGNAVTDSTSLLTFANLQDDTTTLSLTVRDAVGTTVNSTMAVVVADFPDKPSILKSGNALYATTKGNAYQWQYNGKAIPGARDSVYILNIPGFYSVVVSNFGCSRESEELRVDSLATSIDHEASSPFFQWHCDDKVIRLLTNVQNGTPVSVDVYELHGFRRSVTWRREQNGIRIDAHTLPAGTYAVVAKIGTHIVRTVVVLP